MKIKKEKVAVGLSGGVDSAVSAYLLKQQARRFGGQRYEVVGVNLVCWDEGPHCKAREDRKDALTVAMKLGIPFKVLDFQKEYKQKVIDRFYKDYAKGLTPNPDVWCNSEIKFGLFLDWAIKNGFDYVATGHYARRQLRSLGGQAKLLIPRDKHKDQTYFLYQLGQRELEKVLFPLGDLTKKEVREIARGAGLPVAEKKDSVGICFVGDVDVQQFLRRRLEEKEGQVVDVEGKVIGIHKGVWFYTIGQRGGWQIKSGYQRKFGGQAPVMYVVDKDAKRNRLMVGFGAETYRDQFVVGDINWIAQNSNFQFSHQKLKLLGGQAIFKDILVRIRHGGELLSAGVTPVGDELEVVLQEPQRGVAAGQAAVFYKSRVCLGGGVIY